VTPAVTISHGTVSSTRLDVNDEPFLLQIDGDVHPGNSGGAVVDLGGGLVGVAVAAVRQTNISFAIASALVRRSLHGSLGNLRVRRERAGVTVLADRIDPLGRLRGARLLVASPPDTEVVALRDAGGRWRALPGPERSARFDDTGEQGLRASVRWPGTGALVAQVAVQTDDGSPPLAPIRIELEALAATLEGPGALDADEEAPAVAGDAPAVDDAERLRVIFIKSGTEAEIQALAKRPDRFFDPEDDAQDRAEFRDRLIEILAIDWAEDRIRAHHVDTFQTPASGRHAREVAGSVLIRGG